MPDFAQLQALFADFEKIPISDVTSDRRKEVVRGLQTEVRTGRVALTADQLEACRNGDTSLARILSYLIAENDARRGSVAERRADIVSEWERLQRTTASVTTMPLYYAVRSYLTHLKDTPALAVAAQGDRSLLSQISDALPARGLDSGGQIRRALKEIEALLDRSSQVQENPTVLAALTTRKGAVIAALIAALATLAVGVLNNWDKLMGHSGPKAAVSPPPVDASPSKP